MDEKLKKRKRAKKESSFLQAGVENGAMLTTYLFRYTSEYTISSVVVIIVVKFSKFSSHQAAMGH